MLKKILKLGFLFAYILVFGELFFRFMDPQPIMPRYVTAASDGIRQNVPGAVYRQKTTEVDVEIRINSQGIRSDKEFSLEKEEGAYRIVLLGDSFMMGYEVALEDSFAWLLEQRLRDNGLNAEVINLAVSGFGTAEHLVVLQERAAQYSPDLVIMEWHATDPADNIRTNLYEISGGALNKKNSVYLPGVSTRELLMKIPGYEWLIGNSHFYSAVRERAAVMVKNLLVTLNTKQSGGEQAKPVSAQAVETPQKSYLDHLLINAMHESSRQIGAEFMVLDVPRRRSRIEYVSALTLLDLDSLTTTNIVSPMDEIIRQSSSSKKIYLEEGHGHWSKEGNMIVTSVVYDQLINRIGESMKPVEK